MKKSLVEKMAEGRYMSEKYRGVTYYVLDKPRRSAVCICSEAAFWRCFEEGYRPVTRYLNGEDIGK